MGDDALFAELSARLTDELVAAIPAWVERRVCELHDAWAGSTPPEVRAAAVAAGAAAATQLRGELDELFALDLDEQRSNPLHHVRGLVAFPSAVLAEAGVGEVVRDADAERLFPDDVYDLTPGGFVDIAPELHELGLAWGASKAKAHLSRRRTP
ncbi:MAG: hypothetical protein AAFZ07_06280 [Actinomycetota bacterium]